MKNKTFTIKQIRKYLNQKGFSIKKKYNEKKESNLGNISRTFFCSLIIISIFSITPLVINFTKEKIAFVKIHENNSKNNLKKLLENNDTTLDENLNQEFLFEDVLNFDEQLVDTVRLSAATIEELFKSTDYNLEDVRKNKLVKPISLTLLPEEIIKIENTYVFNN